MLWVALVLRDSFGDSGLEFGLGFYGWIRIKSQNLLKIIRTYPPRSPEEGIQNDCLVAKFHENRPCFEENRKLDFYWILKTQSWLFIINKLLRICGEDLKNRNCV